MISFARRRAFHEWKVKQLAYREHARAENLRRFNRQRGFIINPYTFGVSGPTDPDFSSVRSLLHFDTAGTTFTDVIGNTWSRYGTTTAQSATQSKFGGGALEISSTGAGGITSAYAAAGWQFTSNSDYCYEWWAYLTSYTNAHGNQGFHVGQYNGNNGLLLQVLPTGEPQFLNNTTGSSGYDVNITGASAIGLSAWVHLAHVRDGSTFYGYANGVSFGSDTATNTFIVQTPNPFDLGGSWIASTLVLPGHMDDFRLSVGVPRYPGGTSFTPHTTAHPDS